MGASSLQLEGNLARKMGLRGCFAPQNIHFALTSGGILSLAHTITTLQHFASLCFAD